MELYQCGGKCWFFMEIFYWRQIWFYQPILVYENGEQNCFFQSYLRIRKICFRIQEIYVEVHKITGKRYFLDQFNWRRFWVYHPMEMFVVVKHKNGFLASNISNCYKVFWDSILKYGKTRKSSVYLWGGSTGMGICCKI